MRVTTLALCEIEKAAKARVPHPKGLRIGVRGGGCMGFSYVFEWSDKAAEPTDVMLGPYVSVPIFIDPKSLALLQDSTLTYERGLLQRGFKIETPGASSCGCGKSVSL